MPLALVDGTLCSVGLEDPNERIGLRAEISRHQWKCALLIGSILLGGSTSTRSVRASCKVLYSCQCEGVGGWRPVLPAEILELEALSKQSTASNASSAGRG
jgi:hypothetical protein